ncbi:MAG: hypothetical protein OHK0022_16910 [Roseiflexaceae bacterium]
MLYSLVICCSGLVCALLAAWAWHQRSTRGAVPFTLLMLGVSAWSLGYAMELVSVTLPAKIFWSKVEYVGIVTVPVAWVVFALRYVGRDHWLKRHVIGLMALPSLLTLALVWTNEAHGLIWERVQLVPIGALIGWKASYGAGFWLFTAYSYVLLLIGTVQLVRLALRSPDLYRSQAWGIVIATVVPWMGNLIYNAGVMPLGIELAPFSFALTGAVFVLAVFRWQLLELMPVAHDLVFESMSDAVLVLDASQRIIAVNAEGCRLVGLPRAALIGLPVARALHSRPALLAHIQCTLAAGADGAAEAELDLEELQRSYQVRISPLQRWSGTVGGTLVVLNDITPIKRAEQELRRARDAAEAANLAKSTFLATMSHELRTPLTAMMGFSQVLGYDARLSTDQREYLGIISRNGEHLLTLINDVLDIAKVESGRMTLAEAVVDLPALVEDICDMFRLRLHNKGVALHVLYGEDVPARVRVDDRKLRQVLINLLGNAAKFTAQGSITLRIAAQERPDQPDVPLVLFVVEDTGPGIAPEHQERIFEPFSQAPEGSAMHEGTGLGLTISRAFARLMGGDLTVESTLGQGSRFTLAAPLALVQEPQVITEQSEGARRVVGLAPGSQPCRLLVVDDRADLRRLMVALLAPLGFELREAANGLAALAIARDWRPHLVWMDLHMPHLDGSSSARQLKAELQPAPAVVALTASISAADHIAALRAGCDELLCKPVRLDQLLNTIQRHLGVRYVYADQPAPERAVGSVV